MPQTLNTRHGVVVVENLRLGELVAAEVHEFLLVVAHAKLRGATGAVGRAAGGGVTAESRTTAARLP